MPPTSTRFALTTGLLALLLGAARSGEEQRQPSAAIDFDRDVRPILARNCFACHGPDENARRAKLRLDLRDGVLQVAEPGRSATSELLARVTHSDPDERMPPPETAKSLTEEEVEVLRAWIEAGLPWEGHWAFERIRRPFPPYVEEETWVRSAMDRFVLAKLEEEGVARSDTASLQKLLRRVSLDLTGLPPTPRELDDFLLDESPEAYERVVDRLLASDRYGEHMAAWWLDGARYADTNGYQNDFARSMWPWRDWVIAAFNANMPYDRFLTEQLAGDLMANATLEQRIATGFNRNHRMVTEAGSLDEEWRVENVADRVETTATVFLGLTMGCARCHDHKYDPVTQRDYYRFYAYFNNVDERGVYQETRGNVPPLVKVPDDRHHRATVELEERSLLARLDLELGKAKLRTELPSWEAELRASGRASLRALPTASLHIMAGSALGPPAPKRSMAPHISLLGEPGSYVDLGQALAFEEDRPFTLSLWVKPASDGTLLSKMADDDTYRGFDLVLQANGRLLSHLIHDWPENGLKVETEESLVTDRWTHVGYTYDGSGKAAGVRVAFDGRDVPLKTHSDTLDGTLRTSAPLRLGRRHYTNYFGGALADLALYDGVLSGEIRERLRLRRVHALRRLADEEPAGQARAEFLALLQSTYGADLAGAHAALGAIAREREALEAAAPTSMVMAERAERRPTYLLKRGRYDAPDETEELEPGLPAFLGVAQQPRDRLELARWMTSPDNPLTARVVVNQTWQRLFGTGLAETTENLGIQGSRPSHPELLDWLASGLVLGGWDLKALQREIVTSATYRQSSAASPSAFDMDPDNRLLARGSRYRLSAEEIRDQALAVSGLLVERLGGPPTRPYQPAGLWEELAGGAGQGPYVQDTGEGLYRRSLYTHRKRTVPHPSLATFDAPGFDVCQTRRSSTNTPLQALALMNDVTYVEAARALGQRMLQEGGNSARQRIAYGFRLVTSRPAREPELEHLLAGHAQRQREYRAAPASASTLLAHGDSVADPSADPAELAALTLTAGVLLNLDETLTRE